MFDRPASWLRLLPLAAVFACSESAPATTTTMSADLPAASTAPTRTTAPATGPAIARPVPKTAPTVTSTMPAEVQMQAIGYMTAMAEPHDGDVPVDTAWVTSLAERLKPVALSMDKGSADDRARLNRVDVVAGGRRIDVLLAKGCDEHGPMHAVVGGAGVQLPTLLSHGVLVVRCNDAHTQCLQSTRDPSDILCTTAPRHK